MQTMMAQMAEQAKLSADRHHDLVKTQNNLFVQLLDKPAPTINVTHSNSPASAVAKSAKEPTERQVSRKRKREEEETEEESHQAALIHPLADLIGEGTRERRSKSAGNRVCHFSCRIKILNI